MLKIILHSVVLMTLTVLPLLAADSAAELLRVGKYEDVLKAAEAYQVERLAALLHLGRHQDVLKATEQSKDWPALRYRARALHNTGDMNTYAALAKTAAQFARQQSAALDAASLTALASVIHETDVKLAWNLIQQAHQKDATYKQAYRIGAEICIAAFAWQFALSETTSLWRLDKQDAEALALSARALVADNKFSKAHKLLDQALEINPHLTQALNLKALLVMQQRKYNEMDQYLARAEAVNPRNIETKALLAARADAGGDLAERDKIIEQVKNWNPNPYQLYGVLAESSERRYLYPEALDWGRKAQAVYPAHWKGDYDVAVNLLRLGEEKAGYALMEQAFNKNKFNVWAYNMLTVLDEDYKQNKYAEHHTKYFTVKIPKAIDAPLWLYLERWLDPLYESMAERYQCKPSGPKEYEGRILILFFDQHAKFSARTVGLPGLGAAGATFGQVITMPLHDQDTIERAHPWYSTLEHELAHVFTIQKSKRSIPRWLTEGISEWQEREPHVQLDGLLKETIARDQIPLLENMSDGIHYPKYSGQIGLTYYLSGLAVEHFLSSYGQGVINQLLNDLAAGKNIEESLQERSSLSLEELNQAYKKYVKQHAQHIFIQRRFNKQQFAEMSELDKKKPLQGQALYDYCLALIQQGKVATAQRAIERLSEEDDWYDAASILQAQVSLRFARNAQEALSILAPILATDEEHPEANYWAMLAAMQEKDVTTAETYAEQASLAMPRLTRGPNSPYVVLAKIYEDAEDNEALETVLERHVEHDGFYYPAQRSYALLLFELGKWEAASAAIERSIQFSIYDARAHASFGHCQEQLGNSALAIRAYQVALELDETEILALEGLKRLQKD